MKQHKNRCKDCNDHVYPPAIHRCIFVSFTHSFPISLQKYCFFLNCAIQACILYVVKYKKCRILIFDYMNLRKKRNYLPNSNKNINFAHFFAVEMRNMHIFA